MRLTPEQARDAAHKLAAQARAMIPPVVLEQIEFAERVEREAQRQYLAGKKHFDASPLECAYPGANSELEALLQGVT